MSLDLPLVRGHVDPAVALRDSVASAALVRAGEADVIVVDPPRKGCDSVCLDTIVRMQPKRVVYVSCDSATLARDVKYLGERGYEVERVRCCDMFGMSGHVETVALLSQQ